MTSNPKALDMTIEVQNRPAYGKPLYYPVNAIAKACAELVGRKTLLDRDLKRLEALGFKIEWIPQDLPTY